MLFVCWFCTRMLNVTQLKWSVERKVLKCFDCCCCRDRDRDRNWDWVCDWNWAGDRANSRPVSPVPSSRVQLIPVSVQQSVNWLGGILASVFFIILMKSALGMRCTCNLGSSKRLLQRLLCMRLPVSKQLSWVKYVLSVSDMRWKMAHNEAYLLGIFNQLKTKLNRTKPDFDLDSNLQLKLKLKLK